MLVVLDPAEVLDLAEVAARIEYGKRGIPSRDWGVTSWSSRLYSLCAERAVARALGCEHDPVVLVGGDGHVDLWLPEETAVGRSIEVRFRRQRNRDLATQGLRFWEELVADIYVLVWPSAAEDWSPLDGFDIVGWVTRDDFHRRIVSRPPIRMKGEKWEIPYSDLRDFRELVSLSRGRAGQASRR